MTMIYEWINYSCSGLTLLMTLGMLFSFRKPRPFGPLRLLFSAGLSLIILPAYVFISGVRLNPWLGIFLFLCGGLVGVWRGFTVRLYYLDDRVVARYSLVSLLLWGASLALAMLLGQANSPVRVAPGLVPLFFTTGVQVSMNLLLLIRRLLMRPLEPTPI